MKDDTFAKLSPDNIISAVESQGFLADGRLLALNSYENRVYQVGIEEQEPLIAKFYRPGRWSNAQIQEEHDFVAELLEAELPVVPAMRLQGKTLFCHEGLRFSLFQRKGGRAPELDNLDNLYTLGQYMGQIHCVAKAKAFQHREALSINNFGYQAVATVAATLLPDDLRDAYLSITQDILKIVDQRFADFTDLTLLRCHGDCHVGNILWRDDKPHFVDFDDACMAPAM